MAYYKELNQEERFWWADKQIHKEDKPVNYCNADNDCRKVIIFENINYSPQNTQIKNNTLIIAS
jgi:hypothetical protein